MCCGVPCPQARLAGSRALLPLAGGQLLTAGSDRCVRYWEAAWPERSYVVCGPMWPDNLSVADPSTGLLQVRGCYRECLCMAEVVGVTVASACGWWGLVHPDAAGLQSAAVLQHTPPVSACDCSCPFVACTLQATESCTSKILPSSIPIRLQRCEWPPSITLALPTLPLQMPQHAYQYTERRFNDVPVIEETVVGGSPRRVRADAVPDLGAAVRCDDMAHSDCITALASADAGGGRLLLSGSRDGIVKAWR